MAKTLAQVQQQIYKLQLQADALKAKEVPGVIKRIKEAIAHYDLTVEEVFGSAPAAQHAPKAVAAPARAKDKQGKGVVRYRDTTGRTWTGMGPKPQWLKEALAAGQSLDSFKVNGAGGGRMRAMLNGKGDSAGDAAPPAAKKSALSPKYKDAAGHTWSGRGPTPRWMKDAIAGGMTMEQLAA